MAVLSGDWDGSYWTASSAARGKLKLFIGAGVESEYGDVTLTTPLGEHPIADEGPAHRAHTRLAQSLRIDLARVVDGRLMGVLEPYVSPDCGCVVTTTFSGAISGDTIRGTFARRGNGGDVDGEWMAIRAPRSVLFKGGNQVR